MDEVTPAPDVTASDCQPSWHLRRAQVPVTPEVEARQEAGQQWQYRNDSILPEALGQQGEARTKSRQLILVLLLLLLLFGVWEMVLVLFPSR